MDLDEIIDIRRALKRLSRKERAVIVLMFYAGLTDSEAAKVLNANLNTVTSRKFRALHKLRKMMSESGTPGRPGLAGDILR
jgi:RNA polymerase sigma factor (sigma-70 family)